MNPIMIDGTGMCGGCRLTVGGETKFACVDGPDFDGHEVDFDEADQPQRRLVPRVRAPSAEGSWHSSCNTGRKVAECQCRICSMDKTPMPEQDPNVAQRTTSWRWPWATPRRGHGRGRRAASTARITPCVAGCPVGIRHPRLYRQGGRGRLRRPPTMILSRRQRPARHLRPRLPPGEPVRGQVRPGHQGRAGGHRPAGALCGRLGTPSTGRPTWPAATRQRAQGGRHRLRPRRSDLRRRPGPHGLRRHGVRGLPHRRRRARSTASPSSVCPRSHRASARWTGLKKLGVEIETDMVVGNAP